VFVEWENDIVFVGVENDTMFVEWENDIVFVGVGE